MRPFVLHVLCVALIASGVGGCDTAEEPEVSVEDLFEGMGRAAETGLAVTVHYAGWVASTLEPFFSTCDPNTTLQRQLVLGENLIEGWNRGVPGMRAGGIRRLLIPAALAWGTSGGGCDDTGENCLIPPNEAVIFEIQLLDVSHRDSLPPLPATECDPELTTAPPSAL